MSATCNCVGQKWWQDSLKSKTVTADTVKPPSQTSTAVAGAAVKPGARPVPAAAAAQGTGRSAAAAAAAAGRPAGQTPARGDVTVILVSSASSNSYPAQCCSAVAVATQDMSVVDVRK